MSQKSIQGTVGMACLCSMMSGVSPGKTQVTRSDSKWMGNHSAVQYKYNAVIYVILNFLIATLKKLKMDKINFNNIFSLTQYIQNIIISACIQYKKRDMLTVFLGVGEVLNL